jgi:hypothetical protein
MDLLGQSGDATKFFYRSVIKDIYGFKEDHLFYRRKPSLFHRQS